MMSHPTAQLQLIPAHIPVCLIAGGVSGTHRSSRIPWSRSLPSTCSTQSFTSSLMGLVNATSTTTSLFTFASPSTCAKKMLVRPGSQCSFLAEPFQESEEGILWEAMAEFLNVCRAFLSGNKVLSKNSLSLFSATAVRTQGIYLYVNGRIVQGDVSFHKHLNPIFYMT